MLLLLNRPSFRVALFCLLLLAGQESLRAQERTETSSPQKEIPQPSAVTTPNPPLPVSPAVVQPPLMPRLGDGLWLMGEDGKPHPVLPKTNFNEFLEWKLKQEQPAPRPEYSLSDISLTGSATETEAALTVKITIQIPREKEWVNVPLELQEAVLRSFQHEYTPPGESSKRIDGLGQAEFDRFEGRGGYHWWFRGQGQHALSLQMVVPLKKTNGVRRVQLAVPAAASSYLGLKLPIANEQLALEPIAAGAHKTSTLDKSTTLVELFRLGQKLDLGWRTLPDSRQIKTLLKAESELRVEPTEESVLLKARQLIEPLRGSMKELEVTLPGGFSVLELKVDGERYRPLEDFPKSTEPLKIPLPAPTTGRVRLDWILQAPWPTSGQLVVEGFSVGECLRQSGVIGVAGFEGYRIVKRSATDVARVNVRELLGPGPILSAYQFLQQPFQLVLDFQQIEPTYSVRPHLFVKMGSKQIELLADLELEVYRGLLGSVVLEWPDFTEQGWTIDRTELPGLVEDIEQDPDTGRITFPLAKRLTPGTTFRFPLRATRKIENSATSPLALSLPRVIASSPVRTVVVVTDQENVESNITPTEGTETQPLSASFAEEVESLLSQPSLRDFRGPRQTGFLVRSDQQSFLVKLIMHAQSITSETQLRISLNNDRMTVRETLHYDVNYGPVTQLRVMVPRSFPAGAQFLLDTVPLSFEWTGVEAGNSRQARLVLPISMRNQFDIVAQYEIPERDRKENQLQIPCVRASDASAVTGRLEFSADYPSQVTLADLHWTRIAEKEIQNVWTTEQPGETLEIAWSPRNESDTQRFTISQAAVTTAIQQNGHIAARAVYQLERELDHVLISLPPEWIIPDGFAWNGLELAAIQVKESPPGSGTYRLSLPASTESSENAKAPFNGGKPVLAVSYHGTHSTPINWNQQFSLNTPNFPGEVWIENTLWEVAMPVDQHLFTLPEGFTPEFSWIRQGLFWTRSPKSSTNGLTKWMQASADEAGFAIPWEGNTYRFSYYGPCSSLQFTSMNRSMIVLFGAGLALLMGFLLLKIPFTRNVLTVLTAVFAFALCSVWYMAPMQVLLQPAGLGLLLAIVAVLLDSAFNRHRKANAVTLPGSDDYHGSSLGHPPRGYPEAIGSEDPTAVRPASESRPDSRTTQQRSANQGSSEDSSPALIGSSISERPE